MKTIDRTVNSLCAEIDYWKEQAANWKQMYEDEKNENIKQLNERFEESKRGVANAIMFALAVKDDENGNLVIKNEDRKSLAKRLKQKD